MNCIFTMTFSGSIMVLFYLLVKRGAGERLSIVWRYNLLKAAVLYYLIPLPFLAKAYRIFWERIFQEADANKRISYAWRNEGLIISQGSDIYMNQSFQAELLVAGIWMVISAGILITYGMRYLRSRRRLLKCRNNWQDRTKDAMTEQLKEKYNVKQKVYCYGMMMERQALAIGVFRHIILFADDGDEMNREMQLSHEIVHVKHHDVLWKVVVLLVTVLHWYNPLAWWMGREMEQVCEMSCDSVVLQNRTEEEIQQYFRLLIETAKAPKERTLWSAAMSNNAKRIKERMDNVMKRGNEKKTWGKLISACVVGAAVFFNSLTVFAYNDIQYQALNEEIRDNEKIMNGLLYGDTIFVPDGAQEEWEQSGIWQENEKKILYNKQFVDAEGKIYPVDEQMSSHAACTHQFVSGTYNVHVLNSTGGCTVDYYEAQRCTKCNFMQIGKEIQSISFKNCPH